LVIFSNFIVAFYKSLGHGGQVSIRYHPGRAPCPK
jgi:hypothetical protein